MPAKDPEVALRQRQDALRNAQRARFGWIDLRERLRSGALDVGQLLGVHFVTPLIARRSLLEIVGLALIGAGMDGRRAGRTALELCARMPFSVSHWTSVGELSFAQRRRLLIELYAEAGTPEERAAVPSASR